MTTRDDEAARSLAAYPDPVVATLNELRSMFPNDTEEQLLHAYHVAELAGGGVPRRTDTELRKILKHLGWFNR